MQMHKPETISLGRGEWNSIVLPHLRVSRRHAAVSVGEGARAILYDLGSTHGTYLNGGRISRPATLHSNDLISIGPFNLVFDGKGVFQSESRGVSIDVADLTRCIDERTVILDKISLSIQAGQFVVIAGESGAGKTSLLRALLGLDHAQSGKLVVDGIEQEVQLPARLRGIVGYVSQENHLPPSLPLQRALYYVARLRCATDVSKQEVGQRITYLLRVLRLEEQREQRILTLSTGELRRANLAAELICLPPLLLLDEPTAGLDPHFRLEIVTILRALAQRGTTILMASHESSEIQQADKLVMLVKGGRLRYFGSPSEVLDHFGVRTHEEMYALLAGDRPLPRHNGEDSEGGHAHLGTSKSLRRQRSEVQHQQLTFSLLSLQLRMFLFQLRLLLCRYTEVIFTDHVNVAFLLFQAPCIALMIALVSRNYVFSTGTGPFEAQKTLFFMAITAIWFGIINALREINKEYKIVFRERLAGMQLAAYLLSKLVVLGCLSLGQTALLLLIVLAKTGSPPASTSLYVPVVVGVFIGIALAGVAGVALGLCVSAFAGSSNRSLSMAPLILLPQIIFAGVIFLVNGPTQVPAGVTISYWAMRATGTSVNLDHLYYKQLLHIYPVLAAYPDMHVQPSGGTVPPFQPEDYDSSPRFQSYMSVVRVNGPWDDAQPTRRQNLSRAWIMLVCLVLGFIALAYIGLRIRTGHSELLSRILSITRQLLLVIDQAALAVGRRVERWLAHSSS
jgi:ABC-type multidrug transport system ATPase subunit